MSETKKMSLILVSYLSLKNLVPRIVEFAQHGVKSVLKSELSVTVSKDLNLYSVQGNTIFKY